MASFVPPVSFEPEDGFL